MAKLISDSMKAENFKKCSKDDLRFIMIGLIHNINLLPQEIFDYIKKDTDSKKIKKRIDKCYNLIKEEILVRFLDNDIPERYISIPFEDFFVLIDSKAQQEDLKKGDGILFTASDGERKIYIYDECDGYGMGAYDLKGQRYTIAYSHCAKIVTVIDKEIEGLPSISLKHTR